jgi:predicted ATP-grasp superfamily ATP-dependent carboligase
MRVFVCEYLCAEAPQGEPALRREGRAMLAGVLADLAACPEVLPLTLLAEGSADADRLPPGCVVERAPAGRAADAFRRVAAAADATLVIAPEFDGLLAERCRWVEEVGGRLLGPSSRAVELAADKLRLAAVWQGLGVPTPATAALGGRPALKDGATDPSPVNGAEEPALSISPVYGASPCSPVLQDGVALVVKPRDGAGSQATFLVRRPADLPACLAAAAAEGWRGELIAQEHVPGLAASVAFLIGPGQRLALPACEQCLSDDGRFHYRGGRLPLPPPLDDRARRLGAAALAALPGLQGYVGVDLVLGAAADGSADRVLEVNPRLTTSYLGLRMLARFNLAAALLAVTQGTPPPAWEWRPGPIAFAPLE